MSLRLQTLNTNHGVGDWPSLPDHLHEASTTAPPSPMIEADAAETPVFQRRVLPQSPASPVVPSFGFQERPTVTVCLLSFFRAQEVGWAARLAAASIIAPLFPRLNARLEIAASYDPSNANRLDHDIAAALIAAQQQRGTNGQPTPVRPDANVNAASASSSSSTSSNTAGAGGTNEYSVPQDMPSQLFADRLASGWFENVSNYVPPHCDAFIGPGRSSSVRAVGLLVDKPWVGFAASADDLTDAAQPYPFFSRVIPVDSVFTDAIATWMVVGNKWKTANTLCVEEAHSRSVVSRFKASFGLQGGRVLTAQCMSTLASVEDVGVVLDAFIRTNTRIVFVGMLSYAEALNSTIEAFQQRPQLIVVFSDAVCVNNDPHWLRLPGAFCGRFIYNQTKIDHFVAAHHRTLDRQVAVDFFNKAFGFDIKSASDFSTSLSSYMPFALDAVYALFKLFDIAYDSSTLTKLNQHRGSGVQERLQKMLRQNVSWSEPYSGGSLNFTALGDRSASFAMEIENVQPGGTSPSAQLLTLDQIVDTAAVKVCTVADGAVSVAATAFYPKAPVPYETAPSANLWFGEFLQTAPSDVPSQETTSEPFYESRFVKAASGFVLVLLLFVCAVGVVLYRRFRARHVRPTDETKPFVAFFVTVANETALRDQFPVQIRDVMRNVDSIVKTAAKEESCFAARKINTQHLVVAKDPCDAIRCVARICRNVEAAPWERIHANSLQRSTNHLWDNKGKPTAASPNQKGAAGPGDTGMLARVLKKKREEDDGKSVSNPPDSDRAMSSRTGRLSNVSTPAAAAALTPPPNKRTSTGACGDDAPDTDQRVDVSRSRAAAQLSQSRAISDGSDGDARSAKKCLSDDERGSRKRRSMKPAVAVPEISIGVCFCFGTIDIDADNDTIDYAGAAVICAAMVTDMCTANQVLVTETVMTWPDECNGVCATSTKPPGAAERCCSSGTFSYVCTRSLPDTELGADVMQRLRVFQFHPNGVTHHSATPCGGATDDLDCLSDGALSPPEEKAFKMPRGQTVSDGPHRSDSADSGAAPGAVLAALEQATRGLTSRRIVAVVVRVPALRSSNSGYWSRDTTIARCESAMAIACAAAIDSKAALLSFIDGTALFVVGAVSPVPLPAQKAAVLAAACVSAFRTELGVEAFAGIASGVSLSGTMASTSAGATPRYHQHQHSSEDDTAHAVVGGGGERVGALMFIAGVAISRAEWLAAAAEKLAVCDNVDVVKEAGELLLAAESCPNHRLEEGARRASARRSQRDSKSGILVRSPSSRTHGPREGVPVPKTDQTSSVDDRGEAPPLPQAATCCPSILPGEVRSPLPSEADTDDAGSTPQEQQPASSHDDGDLMIGSSSLTPGELQSPLRAFAPAPISRDAQGDVHDDDAPCLPLGTAVNASCGEQNSHPAVETDVSVFPSILQMQSLSGRGPAILTTGALQEDLSVTFELQCVDVAAFPLDLLLPKQQAQPPRRTGGLSSRSQKRQSVGNGEAHFSAVARSVVLNQQTARPPRDVNTCAAGPGATSPVPEPTSLMSPPVLLVAVHRPHDRSDDDVEWLYQVEGHASHNPHRECNAAFEVLMKGEVSSLMCHNEARTHCGSSVWSHSAPLLLQPSVIAQVFDRDVGPAWREPHVWVGNAATPGCSSTSLRELMKRRTPDQPATINPHPLCSNNGRPMQESHDAGLHVAAEAKLQLVANCVASVPLGTRRLRWWTQRLRAENANTTSRNAMDVVRSLAHERALALSSATFSL